MKPFCEKFIIDKIREYDLKIDSGVVGNFEILKRDSLEGEIEGYLYSKEGKINGPISELLGVNKRVWMRLSPKEIEGTYETIKSAKGKVGIVGLGLGYTVQEIAKKPEVSNVIVYEISEDVVELYKRNFGENPKIQIILGDAFKANANDFDLFFVDIYEYKLSMQVVEDYVAFNKLHTIKEYSFFGIEHFLLSCSYEEIVWVFIPENWMDMSRDIADKLNESGYIKYYVPLDEKKVSEVLSSFKKVLE